MSEVNELLKKVKEANARVENNNLKKTQIDAERRATMKQIFELGDKLKAKGINVELSLDADGFLTRESLDSFTKTYEAELSALQKNYETTELLLTAIENKDIETINRLTGSNIKENAMSIHLASLSELKEREKEIRNGDFKNSDDLNFESESKEGFLDFAKNKSGNKAGVSELEVVEEDDLELDLEDDDYEEEDEPITLTQEESLVNDSVFGGFTENVNYVPILENDDQDEDLEEEDDDFDDELVKDELDDLDDAWLNFE